MKRLLFVKATYKLEMKRLRFIRHFISLRTERSLGLLYTCQLFLRYKREIFILVVLGFLKTTRSFLKISEVFRRSRKSSDDVRGLPKTSKVCRRQRYRENAYPQNQRSRGRYCHLFILDNNSHFPIRREKLARKREPA